MVPNEQTTTQVNQEQASLLLTSEKAVFCYIVRVQLFQICASYSLSQVMVLSLRMPQKSSSQSSSQMFRNYLMVVGLLGDWLTQEVIPHEGHQVKLPFCACLRATVPMFSMQTWNLSKNLHDPIFEQKNFTHWKRVNCDYFCQQLNVVNASLSVIWSFLG